MKVVPFSLSLSLSLTYMLMSPYIVAIKSAPCVMILKEIQVLTLCGPNESSYEDEPRLVSAFERFITSVTENTKSRYFQNLLSTNIVYAQSISCNCCGCDR